MKAEIRASCGSGEIRVAVVEQGHLMEYALHRPASPSGVGDLYLGRVTAMLPALGGAFVAIDAATGFLPHKEGAAGLSEGTLIRVRVTRSAQGGKGPRLTAEPGCTGQAHATANGAGLITRGPDALHRLAVEWPLAPILCDDPAVLAQLRPTFGPRVRIVRQAFDDHLEGEIEALAGPEIGLPGGLRASIHPTPALVAIDVDGAASSAERRPKQTVQFAANRAAIPALMHQIRLRNLSGAILIDLAGLATRKRSALAPVIESALARDPQHPRLLGFTSLGFAEILRPRTHPPLHELLESPLGAGLAALRAAERRVASGTPAPCIRAGIAVVAALEADSDALSQFAQRTANPISLRMDPNLPAACWTIENG